MTSSADELAVLETERDTALFRADRAEGERDEQRMRADSLSRKVSRLEALADEWESTGPKQQSTRDLLFEIRAVLDDTHQPDPRADAWEEGYEVGHRAAYYGEKFDDGGNPYRADREEPS